MLKSTVSLFNRNGTSVSYLFMCYPISQLLNDLYDAQKKFISLLSINWSWNQYLSRSSFVRLLRARMRCLWKSGIGVLEYFWYSNTKTISNTCRMVVNSLFVLIRCGHRGSKGRHANFTAKFFKKKQFFHFILRAQTYLIHFTCFV